jgi:SAM-dependent methyltransferase
VANEDQSAYWNGEVATHRIARQERYEATFGRLTEQLLAAALIEPAAAVLDVGCGCGATSLEAARRANAGSVVGIDLSEPMLAASRQQAAAEGLTNVSFVAGDAQTYRFDSGQRFDTVVSRFGVMFFDDPVAAFANLRSTLVQGGRLAFVCWQELAQNPFFLLPGLAIGEHILVPESAPPGAPGPFALADPARIRSVLTDAGLADVTVAPLVQDVQVGGSGSFEDAVEFVATSGAVRAALAAADAATRERALSALSAALAPHARDGGVWLGTATWLVTAGARSRP